MRELEQGRLAAKILSEAGVDREYLTGLARKLDAEDEFNAEAAEFVRLCASIISKKRGHESIGTHKELCFFMEQMGELCPNIVPHLEATELFSRALSQVPGHAVTSEILEQLKKGRLGAFALTDENSGSDPRHMESSAHQSDGKIRLRGTKRHITAIDQSDYFVTFVRENESISAFICESSDARCVLVRRSEWMGLRGHNSWLVKLDDLMPRCRLGEEGEGLKIALTVLTKTKISLAASFLGLARAALNCAIDFASQRRSGSTNLLDLQGVSFPIVDAWAQLEAARATVFNAAHLVDTNRDFTLDAAMAKLVSSQALVKAAAVMADTLAGEAGSSNGDGSRIIRDVNSWVAAQGTDNVQRMLISRSLNRL